jgi:hypothetical protein
MQSIEGWHAELRAIAAAEVCANIEGVFRYCCLKPQAICPVALQRGEDGIRFSLGNLFIKNLFGDGMETFRRVKRCKLQAGLLLHPLSRGCRMHILHVERREKTGIGVDRQKRPRSFSKSSTTFKTRSPNIFFARASKSGHFAGFSSAVSGTMRAITLSRSRSSTVVPARNQAFKRRVSRSCRMLTDGINIM